HCREMIVLFRAVTLAPKITRVTLPRHGRFRPRNAPPRPALAGRVELLRVWPTQPQPFLWVTPQIDRGFACRLPSSGARNVLSRSALACCVGLPRRGLAQPRPFR